MLIGIYSVENGHDNFNAYNSFVTGSKQLKEFAESLLDDFNAKEVVTKEVKGKKGSSTGNDIYKYRNVVLTCNVSFEC